ncbi:MAG TPA: hypothetical protein VFJ43_03520, partial [Bacteroidia bacterium]|nr:hypothetical protein [Bacteroidia bacterium]
MKAFFLFILIFFSRNVFSQHTISLNGLDRQRFEFCANNLDIHSSVKPALDVDFNGKTFNIVDSITKTGVKCYHVDTLSYPRLSFRNYYQRKRAIDDLHTPTESKGAFLIRPVYDFNVGYDLPGKRALFTTVGGAVLDADYKQKIGIEIRCAA